MFKNLKSSVQQKVASYIANNIIKSHADDPLMKESLYDVSGIICKIIEDNWGTISEVVATTKNSYKEIYNTINTINNKDKKKIKDVVLLIKNHLDKKTVY